MNLSKLANAILRIEQRIAALVEDERAIVAVASAFHKGGIAGGVAALLTLGGFPPALAAYLPALVAAIVAAYHAIKAHAEQDPIPSASVGFKAND